GAHGRGEGIVRVDAREVTIASLAHVVGGGEGELEAVLGGGLPVGEQSSEHRPVGHVLLVRPVADLAARGALDPTRAVPVVGAGGGVVEAAGGLVVAGDGGDAGLVAEVELVLRVTADAALAIGRLPVGDG